MTKTMLVIVGALLLGATLTACKSQADKCLGTGWVSTDLAACEAACNDTSLPVYKQYESCLFAGRIHHRGPQLKKHDQAKARAFLTKGCRLGGTTACYVLKTELEKKR